MHASIRKPLEIFRKRSHLLNVLVYRYFHEDICNDLTMVYSEFMFVYDINFNNVSLLLKFLKCIVKNITFICIIQQ